MTPRILAALAAYLIGGVPFGYLLFRWRRGGDIRSVGSGNIGATNVARAAGWAVGMTTLLLDAAKGVAAVALARAICENDRAGAAAAALAAVAGHCFPIYLGFRGGKGVATGCGAFAVLDPKSMGIALAAFAIAVALTRMVSAGSVLAALAFPAACAATGFGAIPASLAALAGGLIVLRHHENLTRILRGVEPRLGSAGDAGEGERR
ncbi:MAG: glycerol-3-phosphate 1-O-acyltransferase PlsY [Acidobacteria bacterium]|nr:glycerol-3-phosphate 1-O-acyltransferase PlsY [Acidobacteriota bacterium]